MLHCFFLTNYVLWINGIVMFFHASDKYFAFSVFKIQFFECWIKIEMKIYLEEADTFLVLVELVSM